MQASLIVFAAELEDATREAAGIYPRSVAQVLWWILLAIATAAGLLLYGLFRWAAGAPEIDDETAKEHFRAEQDWRGLRRSGENVPPAGASKEVKIPG